MCIDWRLVIAKAYISSSLSFSQCNLSIASFNTGCSKEPYIVILFHQIQRGQREFRVGKFTKEMKKKIITLEESHLHTIIRKI